jgi:hypothetical protein
VNVTTNIEIGSLAQSGTGPTAMAKTFDQPQQTFSDSLSAVSKASSETDNANDGNTTATSRKKSTSGDAESTSSVDQGSTGSSVVSQLVMQPETVVPAQQTPISTSDGGLSGNTVAITNAADEVAAQPASFLQGIASSINDSSQTASKLAGVGVQNIDASGLSLSDAGNGVFGIDANGVANTAPNVSSDINTDAASSLGQDEVANSSQKLTQDVVLNGASSAARSADSVMVAQTATDASAKTVAASATGKASTDQVTPMVFASDQTVPVAGPNASSSTANQTVNKSGDGSAVAIGSVVSNLKSVLTAKESALSSADVKTASKNTVTDATSDASGSVKHIKSAAEQSESQAGTQQSTSSGDQSQTGASAQGQNVVPIQMNAANASVTTMVQPQSAASTSVTQSASQHADASSSAAGSLLTVASASDALPQSLPVINSAKLINTMGQSEMRVGMRSTEFGNISISTTASKDVITAQISLDHSELAKTLAAQLPEMEARLGSGQAVNVHIDMNGSGVGQGTGQGADTSGNTASSSYDQSRSGGQQSTYAPSSYASNSNVENQLSPAVATATKGYESANSRLDIRV